MTRTLVVMRHAKSSWETDDPDIDRPLARRGERDAAAAGALLAARGLRPDVVLLSPATRAAQTWAGVRRGGLHADDVRTVRDIYERDADALVAAVRELPDEARTVLVVGHHPGVPEAVTLVAAREATECWRRLDERFPTSALAVVELDAGWSALGVTTARLVAFEVPRG